MTAFTHPGCPKHHGNSTYSCLCADLWWAEFDMAQRLLAELEHAASAYANATNGISGDLGARLTDARAFLRQEPR